MHVIAKRTSPRSSAIQRALGLVALASALALSTACKSRSYNTTGSGAASEAEDGPFPEPVRAPAYETFLLRRDHALTDTFTTSRSWRKLCAKKSEIPTPENVEATPSDAKDVLERWGNGKGPGADALLARFIRSAEARIQSLTPAQVFVLEKSARPDTFPEKAFADAKTEAGTDGICFFNREVPHELLGLNKDAFLSNKDEANYEVNFGIDTEGHAGIDFFSLFLGEGADGELRKDSGVNTGLLKRSMELAKGMGARTLTVYGSAVINPKIARVLTKRYDFVLIDGDGGKGSTFARKFDLAAEGATPAF